MRLEMLNVDITKAFEHQTHASFFTNTTKHTNETSPTTQATTTRTMETVATKTDASNLD